MSKRKDPLLGTDYTAIKLIGRGAMGNVWQAKHQELGKPVAVKVLQLGATSANNIDRLRYEAQAAARIGDPRLVEVFDMGNTLDGRVFYAMELLEGSSLQQEITRRTLPVREIRTIMVEVLEGLQALHREGFIHRDVKPSNIFYCKEQHRQPRRIKLLDLGLLKRSPSASKHALGARLKPISTPTKPGSILGTPRYLSPEQVLGQHIDHRADVYSAGIVLYRLLAERGPFTESSQIDLLIAHLHSIPEPPSKHSTRPITKELDEIVMRAIAKDPQDRFESALQFADALRTVRLEPLSALNTDSETMLAPNTVVMTERIVEASKTEPMPPEPTNPPPPTVPLSSSDLTTPMEDARPSESPLAGPTDVPVSPLLIRNGTLIGAAVLLITLTLIWLLT